MKSLSILIHHDLIKSTKISIIQRNIEINLQKHEED